MKTQQLTRHEQLILDAMHHNNPHAAMGATIGVQQVYLRVERVLAEDCSEPWQTFERLVWDLVRAGIVAVTPYGSATPCETRTLSNPSGKVSPLSGRPVVYHTMSLR